MVKTSYVDSAHYKKCDMYLEIEGERQTLMMHS